MAQKLLKALQAHARIEHIRGEGMPQTMKGVVLVLKAGFGQVLPKQCPSRCVAHGVPALRIKEKHLVRLSREKPCFQGITGIIAQIDNPAYRILLRLRDLDSAFGKMDIFYVGAQQLANTHSRP